MCMVPSVAKRAHTPGVTGRNVRRLREAQKLSRAALAERAGLGVHTISELELGYRDNPTQETIRRLAEALGVTPEELTHEVGSSELGPVIDAFLASELSSALPGGPPTDEEILWLRGFPRVVWARLPPTPIAIYHMLLARRSSSKAR